MAELLNIREALEAQSWSCHDNGSPLYGQLLADLVRDDDAGGVTALLLDGVSEQPQHDALPLRYLATGHRLALAGQAPELARHYWSCGGEWDGAANVGGDFLNTARANIDEFRLGVRRNVQTNEVARAGALASGFCAIARRSGLPIDQLEVGSSAGLLSRWDHYWYDTGVSSYGDPDSSVRFGSQWWRDNPPRLDVDAVVIRRRASDIAPLDTRSEVARTTSLSFVWPDQRERIVRLRAALEIAASVRLDVDEADAGEWLERELEDAPTEGAATVVFHSIVWQYLSRATRDRVRAAVHAAASRGTSAAPLFWMRFEPLHRTHASLRLASYPAGSDEELAHVGYHGQDITWLVTD